jgi:hypothetical protein
MQIRAATLDDVERLAAFMGRCTLAHQGVQRASKDEMRQRLTRPGTYPELDTWLVEGVDGEIVGFAQVCTEPPALVCYVRVDQPGPHGAGNREHAARARSEPRARPLATAKSLARDELAERRVRGASPRECRFRADPLLLADDDRLRRGARAAGVALGRPRRALEERSELLPIHEARTEVFLDGRQDFDEWLHEYGWRRLRSDAVVRRGGRRGHRRLRALHTGARGGPGGGLRQRARRPRGPARRGARPRAAPADVPRVPSARQAASLAARRRRQPDRSPPALQTSRDAPRSAARRLGARAGAARRFSPLRRDVRPAAVEGRTAAEDDFEGFVQEP